MRHYLQISLYVLVCCFVLTDTAVADGKVFASQGEAIRGYDPVAYHRGGPAKGSDEFTYNWNGAVWKFASTDNLNAFKASPEKYAPQYGGYCAWAVSQGYTASTDPTAWKIVDGRLFLNYSKSIQKRWEKDIPGLIAAGDANWPGIENDLDG